MEFTYQGKSIYYESHGRGEPLLILNGIFMTCGSWAAFVNAFSKSNRLLLLDFLDQGRSAKIDAEYTQELQEELVIAFLDHLKLEKASLCGISYGGEVAMRVAARHPGRVKKLVLANTTAYTSPWLKEIGHSWEYAFASGDGRQFFKTCIPTVYSPGFFERNYAWAREREAMFVKLFTQDVYDAFGRLTRSAENHDERQNLKDIAAPTLVISSEHDAITLPFLQRELAAAIPGAGHVVISGAGHASMYEKPSEFTALVLGFINLNDEIQIL